MKKLSLLLSLLLSLGLLLTYSCSSDDDNGDDDGNNNIPSKIRIVEHNDFQAIDSTFHSFSYNEKKLMTKELFRDKNKVVFKALVHEYTSDGKVLRTKEYQDEAMTIVASLTNYTLDGSGNVVKSVNDRAGNITTIDYTYNSGRLTKAHIEYTGASSGPAEEYVFHWDNNNISKVEHMVPDSTTGTGFMLQEYNEYEYDSKKNPYTEFSIPTLDPVKISENNVVKIKTYDAYDVFQHLTTFQFTKYYGDFPQDAFYDYGFKQGVYSYVYKEI